MSDTLQLPDLQEYALNYLSRYSNTEAGLKLLLNKKIYRWIKMIRQEGRSEEEIEDASRQLHGQITQIIQKMKGMGGIDDETFATLKLPFLIRSGYSKKLIQKRFLQKGIQPSIIDQTLEQFKEETIELGSALAYAKKRKIGPFRRVELEQTEERKQKEQMMLARRGFSYDIVSQIMSMTRLKAESYIRRVQQL